MIKKIIALILTVIFLVPCVSIAQENAADVNTEDRVNITGLFTELGINAEVSADGVTRGEFLLSVAGLMNYDLDTAADSVFDDIESGSELSSAAAFCLSAGIISRADEFRPDDTILENEALKILVCMLGYASGAEKSGGYPGGYVSEAVKLKLLKSIKLSEDGVLSADNFYTLMKNTIEADVREIDEYSKNGYSVKADRTILEICHDVACVEGIVNANEYAFLYENAQNAGKRRAVIGDEDYKLAESANIPPLGYYVKAYVRNNGFDDGEIIYYYEENNTVSEFDLSDAEINSQKITISEKGKKTKSFVLSKNAAVIYNGKPYSGKLSEMLTDGNGKIELIKRKSDSDYGLLTVWESSFMKIGTINTADKLIYDEKTTNCIDYSDKDAVLNVKNDAALKKGDVIEYFESQDKKLYTVSVLDKITAAADAKTDSEVTIGAVEYHMTEYFKREYLNTLRLDTEFDFYLSENGNVVMCLNPSDGDYLYAYLTKGCAAKGLKDAEIELFTEKGEYKTFKLSERISIDGVKLSGDDLYKAIEPHLNSLVRINPQAESGNLKFINTDRTPDSYDTTGDTNYWFETDTLKTGEESKLLKRFRYNSNEDETFYYKSSGYFVPYFSISDETRIFCVMKDGYHTEEDDRVSLGAGTAFLPNDESVTAGDIIAYNVDSSGFAEAIVYKTENYGAPINYESSYGVVSDMYMRKNSDGDMDLAIEVYAGDSFKLLLVSEDETWYNEIEKKQNGFPYAKGDVIRYSVDKKGYIKNQPILDFNAETMTVENDGAENSSLHYTFGYLYDNGDNSVTVIDAEDGKIKCYRGKITSCGYVPKKDSISTIYADRLVNYRQAGENCSRVLLKCRSSQVEAYIVYE